MLALPLLDALYGQQEVCILRYIGGYIDDAGRTYKLAHRNGVGGIVRQIFTCDPVDRRVEVRAGMLAQVQHIPVPGRATSVVARDLADGQCRRGRKYGR